MARRRPYNAESLSRALTHHGIAHVVPERWLDPWSIETGIGSEEWRPALVYAYVVGLADARRRFDPQGYLFPADQGDDR